MSERERKGDKTSRRLLSCMFRVCLATDDDPTSSLKADPNLESWSCLSGFIFFPSYFFLGKGNQVKKKQKQLVGKVMVAYPA